MDARVAVRTSGSANPFTSCHRGALEHLDGGEIGHGDLETGNRFDGNGAHPGDGPGKRNPTGGRSTDRFSLEGGVVDSPMTGILADREVVGGHIGIRNRWAQTHGGDSQCSKHFSSLWPR